MVVPPNARRKEEITEFHLSNPNAASLNFIAKF
jgi:hypothetical protein